ncbi:single-stranded binding protein [Prevotella dentalis DSM 3688]|uniref:Single-stranded DNA-binding protein n=2 Tax=Prevotella dentalis (strain ATCC 49559 / DSM 3688 / JCM 13448 / NCTC 12043 / ES 2772) TaxID=908937 RepID=F9D0H5_PREDD|nr:single-stranded DNA-binding protein [Prevotella dentalis]EGQ16991.1 single-stranded binding protein [Prevotella dentalis DSM 3688]
MNKVMLIGNVGKEPDVRYYDADQAVAKLSLATTERGYTLKNGTQVPDHTDWHNLLFYRQLAKIVEQYVHKGDKLYIEGRLRYSTYDDPQGKRRYVTEILVENMEMLTPKTRPATDPNRPTSNGSRPSSDGSQPVSMPGTAAPTAAETPDDGGLPF